MVLGSMFEFKLLDFSLVFFSNGVGLLSLRTKGSEFLQDLHQFRPSFASLSTKFTSLTFSIMCRLQDEKRKKKHEKKRFGAAFLFLSSLV
jgi:hypothetical protein